MTTNDVERPEEETTAPQLKRAKDFAEEFGGTIRCLRTAQGISLRTFASKVDFSPAYLSKIERGEFSPPGEQKIIALADELKQDPDELLSVAGRIASDLPAIIRQHPHQYACFLRAAKDLSSEQLEQLTVQCKQFKVAQRTLFGGDESER